MEGRDRGREERREEKTSFFDITNNSIIEP